MPKAEAKRGNSSVATSRVIATAAFLETNEAQGAAPAAGENAAAFATLCLVINSALNPKLPAQLTTKASEVLDFAAAVNLTTIGSEALTDVIDNHDKTHDKLKPNSIQSKTCATDKWDFCARGGRKAKELKDNSEFKELRQAVISPPQATQIVKTVAAIKGIAKDLTNQAAAASDKTITGDLNEALYGAKSEPETMTVATTGQNRKATCGETGGDNSGAQAGKSLAQDALCLCAKDTAQTTSDACSVLGKYNVAVTADQDVNSKADWDKLKGACEEATTATDGSPEGIAATIAAVIREITGTKSTGNKINVLGQLQGAGSAGCDGAEDTTNGGACVYYGTAQGTGGISKIEWSKKMASAADKLIAAHVAAARAQNLELHLIELNRTLARIASNINNVVPTSTMTTQNKGKDKSTEGSEQRCEKHTDKTEEQCKSLSSDHDAENEKCKPKAGTDNTTAETGEPTSTAAKKCSDKKSEAVCTDGCKWEGTERKDSSIIVNKKLALMTAATFMR
uniref:Variant surface glycoprotein 1125.458 n=1 Tax=Trypanosoma brucei TaxID=5691 RepID=A0A1J0R5X0_9TRYP|nr:variant surface glycoprotein 1125.458 [Trypanosoma brucei]